jgi:hypothetical protein
MIGRCQTTRRRLCLVGPDVDNIPCNPLLVGPSINPGPQGFEHRAFECLKCGYSEKRILASDPLKSNAVGWVKSELRPRN